MAVLGTTSSIGLERPTSDRKVQGSTPWSCTSKSEITTDLNIFICKIVPEF